MARRKKQRRAAPGVNREAIVAVRCHADYKAWLARFAERERTTVTELIDRGLVDLARKQGFEGPPRR